jgi:retinol dehydrogenase-14
MSRVLLPLLKTSEQGAQTSIYLASSPDLDSVTGQYFARGKPKSANKDAYDTELTAKLWQVSADLVGLDNTKVSDELGGTFSSGMPD